MTLLLDTHCFLWFVLNDPHLGVNAKLAIEDPANTVLISPASYWEIAIKISTGRYKLNGSFEEFWRAGMEKNGMTVLPIELRHVAQLLSLPFHHKDPFDRLIVAQALSDRIILASIDAAFDAYGVSRIW